MTLDLTFSLHYPFLCGRIKIRYKSKYDFNFQISAKRNRTNLVVAVQGTFIP